MAHVHSGRRLGKIVGLVICVLICALGLWTPSHAADVPELMQQACDDGDGDACYRLALRYEAGDSLPVDTKVAKALYWKGCKADFFQACFSGCLREVPKTCGRMGDNSDELWRPMRAFLALQDPEQRRLFIGDSRSLSFLRKLVTSKYVETRRLRDYEAIRRAVYERASVLAQTDPSPGIREWAVGDAHFGVPTELLRQIAKNDPAPNVRQRAQEHLVQRLGPRWNVEHAAELARMVKSRDAHTRELAVGRIVDLALVVKLAKKDPDVNVRSAAVDRLREQPHAFRSVLARIAARDRNEDIRISAASAVTDRKVLERLLRKSRSEMVREIALGKLEDQGVDESLLLWVVEHDGSDRLREQAVRQITDPVTLERLARSSGSVVVRVVATAMLQDQKVLGEIAVLDSDSLVRRTAITTIKDQTVLADVVRRRPDEEVLRQVAGRATEQGLLAGIAKRAQEWMTRRDVVRKLTDMQTLGAIASGDSVKMVREEARRRLAELQSERSAP